MATNQTDWSAVVSALAAEIAKEVGKEVRAALAERAALDAVEFGTRPQREPNLPRRMSIRQAAEYIGVPEKTFRGWRKNHQIPIQAIKVSPRKVLYDRADLDRWIAAMRERKPNV